MTKTQDSPTAHPFAAADMVTTAGLLKAGETFRIADGLDVVEVTATYVERSGYSGTTTIVGAVLRVATLNARDRFRGAPAVVRTPNGLKVRSDARVYVFAR